MELIRKFRQKLHDGAVCFGAGITFTDPTVTEALCGSVDFLWIDMEHTALSLESLQGHLVAARAGGVPALVRVPGTDPAFLKPVLDAGADGLIAQQLPGAEHGPGRGWCASTSGQTGLSGRECASPRQAPVGQERRHRAASLSRRVVS